MEDFWKRAKSFAEEAAKKSQNLTLPSPSTTTSTFANLVAETAKKSKELALEASKKADQLKVADLVAEASKKADQFKLAALKQADQIQNFKSISDIIGSSVSDSAAEISDQELPTYGITDDLREFVKGLTSTTFQAFPVQDVAEADDVPATASNVRKDLTEWQERHATLVLANVKQISKLRYELCPRVMKERRFWRIYFTLVSTHVGPYERKYMEEIKRKAEEGKGDEVKKSPVAGELEGTEQSVNKNRISTSSSAEQDLDTFLLGDLEDSDGPDDGDRDGDLDDDFDKIGNSDIDDERHSPKAATATS